MAEYKVTGSHKVAGVAPGGLVDDAMLVKADVASLIATGHIAPAKAEKSATSKKAVEADTTPTTSEEE